MVHKVTFLTPILIDRFPQTSPIHATNLVYVSYVFLFFEMLIHRSILSRHSSHRWQHELKRVQWTKQKRLMLVSHREKQVHLLQTNTIESIANEAAFYSCIGAASSNSMQKYETRDQRCLLIPAHLIFHFCPFENKNPVMAAATNFNNNNAIDEEDRCSEIHKRLCDNPSSIQPQALPQPIIPYFMPFFSS